MVKQPLTDLLPKIKACNMLSASNGGMPVLSPLRPCGNRPHNQPQTGAEQPEHLSFKSVGK